VVAYQTKNAGNGSGTVVKSRCVLTASHVLAGDSLPAVVLATTELGQNVVSDASAPGMGVSRITRLSDYLDSDRDIDVDLGLAWLDPRSPHPAEPWVMLAADQPFRAINLDGPTGATLGAPLRGLGYSADCNDPASVFGVQSASNFKVVGFGLATPDQVDPSLLAPHLPTLLELRGWPPACPGDSGGPLIDPQTGTIDAVLAGVNRDDGTLFHGTSLLPYAPWLSERLARFCAPHFSIAVSSDGPHFVIGVAEADSTRGEIIHCTGDSSEVCAYGYGSYQDLNGRNQLIGVGRVVLTASDVDSAGGRACVRGWQASPPGSICPCLEYAPDDEGITPARSCTVALIDATQPRSNELQERGDREWLGQTFTGNRCPVVYVQRAPGEACPLE
jgi:hypothetical protein